MEVHTKNGCIIDAENPLSLLPQQLSVLSRQWPSAWCHGPHSMPADPRAQEPAWPETTPFPLLTSIKAIIWEKRATLFCTNRFGLSHILVRRGGRRRNEAPRGRKKRHHVAHLSVSKYSIIFLSHTASCFCYGAVLHQQRCERERWC